MSETAGNGTAVRIANLERAVNRLERLEPAVVKQQVVDIREDIGEIKRDLAAVKKLLISFFIGTALALVTTTLTLLQGIAG